MQDSTLPFRIADRLRRDILTGRLSPGSAIKERDNAAELGVSRTPMREAIRILAQEGLVVLRPLRSPVVANPTVKEVRDQAIVMLTLEKLSGSLACDAATDEELERLVLHHKAFVESVSASDSVESFEMDMRFHSMVVEIAHNDALAESHGALLARLWRSRYLAARQKKNRDLVIDEHTAILEALIARDPLATNFALEAHLGRLVHDSGDSLERERSVAPLPATDVGLIPSGD